MKLTQECVKYCINRAEHTGPPFQKIGSQYRHRAMVSCRSQWPHGLRYEMGSNPTQGMDVCVLLFCVSVVLCVGSGLATG
jgi:hypothetical protein